MLSRNALKLLPQPCKSPMIHVLIVRSESKARLRSQDDAERLFQILDEVFYVFQSYG